MINVLFPNLFLCKYVLSHVIMIKEEQYESINKFEMAFIDEVEKQNELLIKIQHLSQDCDVPSRDIRDLKLSQKMDLHIEVYFILNGSN